MFSLLVTSRRQSIWGALTVSMGCLRTLLVLMAQASPWRFEAFTAQLGLGVRTPLVLTGRKARPVPLPLSCCCAVGCSSNWPEDVALAVSPALANAGLQCNGQLANWVCRPKAGIHLHCPTSLCRAVLHGWDCQFRSIWQYPKDAPATTRSSTPTRLCGACPSIDRLVQSNSAGAQAIHTV